MDDERFETLYRIVMNFAPRRGKRVVYSDGMILLVLLWSAMRRIPRYRACDESNAPRALADVTLPCDSQLSRRLRSAAFAAFYARFIAHVMSLQEQDREALLSCYVIDAKALEVSPFTKDKEARRGWATAHLAKGYKLFLLIDRDGRVVAYRVDAMNRAEQTVALDLLKHAERPGYTLGDSVYDTKDCHDAAAARGQQLIAPRKEPSGNVSARAATPERLHAITMLETPCSSAFGWRMYDQRTAIERVFALMSSGTVGMDSLPPWVRTLGRVRMWVEAMIVFYIAFKPHAENKELRR